MARQTAKGFAETDASDGDPPDASPALPDGLAAARLWVGRWMWIARGTAGVLLEMQRRGAQSATIWAETIEMGAREAQEADRMDRLLAVPMHMFRRQFEAETRHYAEGLHRVLASEREWLESLREGMAWTTGQPGDGST